MRLAEAREIYQNSRLTLCTKLWYISLMRIATEKIRSLCRKRNMSISQLLRRSGVSRNAYYSLARTDSVLPRSILILADYLGVRPTDLLSEDSRELEKARSLLRKIDNIMARHKHADRDTIRHTLLLLQAKPIDRLRRALIRARQTDIRRERS